MSYKIILVCCLVVCFGCADKQASDDPQKQKRDVPVATWQPPAAGTLVDEYEKKVEEDKLNNKVFKVSIISTEQSKEGVFLMKFNHGYNAHEKELSFPKWPSSIILKPVLKAGADKYHCLVGFDASDGQFHEFYEVKVVDGDLAIKQTTGYYEDKKK